MVHAVIAARAPGTTVIDLTHHIPPFDVRAGSHALERAVPFLGPGVVLAVVDPGVGTLRRGIGLRVAMAAGGSLPFVGPDNGLLVGRGGGRRRGTGGAGRRVDTPTDAAREGRDLRRARPVRPRRRGPLSRAARLEELGEPVDPMSLVRLVGGVVEEGRLDDGRALPAHRGHLGRPLRQPAAGGDRGRRAGGRDPSGGSVELAARVEAGRQHPDGLPRALVPDGVQLRCVDAFGELEPGEFGLLVDANGHLAVVAGAASAAGWLNVAAGELLVLAW